ncbi:MAG: hypothetical protein WCZ11_00510 [Bacilli bacterium]
MMGKMKYHQWFSGMKNNLNKYIKITGFCFLFIFFGFILASCNNKSYPRPTQAYYVNDFAEVFLPATKHNIIKKGEDLYDISKSYEDNGGTQIVFASFIVENETDLSSWETNKTELFREWKIGKNDMGVLVLFFFIEEEIDGITYKTFVEPVGFEIGYRMTQYLTSSRLGIIYNSIDFESDFDMGVTQLLHEILRVICTKAYNFEEFDSWEIAKEGYQDYYDNFFEEDVITDIPMNIILFIFSPYSSVLDKILAIIPFALILLGGGFVINKGKGGSSGGAGLFRRRR